MFNLGNEVRGFVKMIQQLWCCCVVNILFECFFIQSEDEIEDVFSLEIILKDVFCVKEIFKLFDLYEKNEFVGKFGFFFFIVLLLKNLGN